MSTRKSATMTTLIDFADSYNMFSGVESVLCAVSGGKDSMCLLHMLSKLGRERGFTVIAAHFNHCLRGAESDRDEQFVENWCEKERIICYTGRGDVKSNASETGRGIEDAARSLRYAFLREAAARHGAGRVATAHTADDNAETVLLNLARGSGLRGLCGIPPVRGNIIRPMLMLSRRDVEEYLSENDVPNIEDSTNAADDYARNRVRHNIIPQLRGINGAFCGNVTKATLLLREDERFLSGLAESFIAEHEDKNSLPADKLRQLDAPVAARVLRIFSKRELGYEHVKALMALCAPESVHAAADIPGLRVYREFNRLVFGAQEALQPETAVIHPGQTIEMPERGFVLKCRESDCGEEINRTFNIFCFKKSNICGNITVTSRLPGDKIRISGRGVTKSLKKLFAEAGLTLADRELTPVLRDDAGIIGVYGFGCAERCQAEPGDRAVIIEIERFTAEE